jgi:hypothetical protein
VKYFLVDGSKDSWTLGKVTARREKALSELGIARENFAVPSEGEKSADDVIKDILKECGDSLVKLIATLFEGREIKKEELEDIDKVEVQKGVMAFFLSELELLTKYNDLLTTLPLQK